MLPNETLRLGQVFGKGLQLWAVTFTKVLPLAILFFLWLSIPHLWLHGKGLTAILLETQMTWWAFVIYIVIYLLGVFVLYIAIYRRVYRTALGESGSFWCALGIGFKKLLVLIIACLVSMAAVIVGLMLLLIPGAYLAFVISLFYPLIIIDDINNPFKGLKYFFQLIWGNWWRSFIVTFIPMVLFWAVGFSIERWALHVGIERFLGHNLWIFNSGLQVLFSAIYLPISAGIFIIQLNDLKLRLRLQQKIKNSHSTNNIVGDGA